jgi:hypothetical protein
MRRAFREMDEDRSGCVSTATLTTPQAFGRR